jgi:Cactus-binding C-terminus of cactin protein
LLVWKARAKLKNVYHSVMESRLSTLRNHNLNEAETVRNRLQPLIQDGKLGHQDGANSTSEYRKSRDPDPFLHLRPENKNHEVVDERIFLDRIIAERRKVSRMGFVPAKQIKNEKLASVTEKRIAGDRTSISLSRFATVPAEDFSQATKALYEREVARGIGEDEEIFTGEEEVDTKSKALWSGKYRPRKPRYFNRVQMGYEWNKYNQTHYDHDNPPPKVVQGYKFNVFYPDLIDKTKAPTYRIEREGGRKKGQSFAPAGEEDTCVIRFMSGPPYEDIAFRIVDKEWDYSAKRDRGFKSSFDKGILQLSFQFKKIYYRK